MVEIDSLFLGALVGTLFSFAAGYLLHIAGEEHKRKVNRRNAAESVTSELEETQKDLYAKIKSSTELEQVKERFKLQNYSFTIVQVTAASIDSIIYSGILRDFDTATRSAMIRCYEEIKISNEMHMKYYDMLRLQMKSDEARAKMLLSYYVKLNDKLKLITELIPPVIDKLKPYLR